MAANDGLLHRITHRLPRVPPHEERSTGHQGRSHPPSVNSGSNHSPSRPPRVLAAWQRRIAALFGQQV